MCSLFTFVVDTKSTKRLKEERPRTVMSACNDCSTQFHKIILRYKKIGYNINVIRQTACMVVNPITVNNFASLFNCTPAG